MLDRVDAKITALEHAHKLPSSFVARLRGMRKTKRGSVPKTSGVSEPKVRHLLLIRILPRLMTLNGRAVTKVEHEAAPMVWCPAILKVLEAATALPAPPPPPRRSGKKKTVKIVTPSIESNQRDATGDGSPARRFWEGVALGTHRPPHPEDDGTPNPTPHRTQPYVSPDPTPGQVEMEVVNGSLDTPSVSPSPRWQRSTQADGSVDKSPNPTPRPSPSPAPDRAALSGVDLDLGLGRESVLRGILGAGQSPNRRRTDELERQVMAITTDNDDLQLILKKRESQIAVLTAKQDYLIQTNKDLLQELDDIKAKSRAAADEWSVKFAEMRDALMEMCSAEILSPPRSAVGVGPGFG